MKKILLSTMATALFMQIGAQSFYDEGTVQKIEIVFAESNWDALLDAEKAGDENYIMAQSVTINGVLFDSVGVKYKGNSTYKANYNKNPLHIELDTYKEHEYDGYTDIKLSNVAKDPSFIREVLSYKILRQYMDAPLSNYANVYINGALIGVYSNSESISKKFVNKRFGSKTNTFVKCNPPAGAGQGSTDYPNLVYKGTDSALYYAAYELKSDFGWNELISLCDNLKNNIIDIEKILDVDRALWMLAFDNTLVNLDSYIGGFAQNYYLYRDDFGRFLPVVWDLNESFGTFSNTGSGNLNTTTSKQQMSHLLHASDANFPLISQLLSVPTYKKMYLAHCKTFLTENFTNDGSYYTQGKAFQTTVDASVNADPNKFYSYANFTSNLTSDISSGGGPGGSSTPGVTNLMNGRYTYLMGLSDFSATEPTITKPTVSNSSPVIGENLTFTTKVENASEVFLKYRGKIHAPFEKMQMYDDGLHDDGAAGDKVYGAQLSISTAIMEYYYYAQNSTIGKFSPTNAEHEYYNLMAGAAVVGDIVINEFMASNDTTQADQDGQYDDWIELYNKGVASVDISRYRLTDNKNKFNQFAFPAGTTIAPGQYLIVWADGNLTQSGYHADFKLSASGETLYLADSNLNILDSIEFPAQTTDVSYGRFPNGTGNFSSMPATFSKINKQFTTSTKVIKEITFNIYPNPAQAQFTIDLKTDASTYLVGIYNMHGKLIFSSKISNTLNINTQTWSPGMYVVKVGSKYSKLQIN